MSDTANSPIQKKVIDILIAIQDFLKILQQYIANPIEGTLIASLKHLVELIESTKTDMHKMTLDNADISTTIRVIPSDKFKIDAFNAAIEDYLV